MSVLRNKDLVKRLLVMTLCGIIVFSIHSLQPLLYAVAEPSDANGSQLPSVTAASQETMSSDAAMTVTGDVYDVITSSSDWQYLDDGSDQGTSWRTVSYDDSSWNTGTAPFGYGGGELPITTSISYGGDSGNKHVTTYFRKDFEIDDVNEIKQLSGVLYRDDGAVVYLNGVEVYRSNLPSGEIINTTFATGAVNNERDAYRFDIDPTLLQNGVNVIAAEVHQVNLTSSDTFFNMELTSSTDEPIQNQGLLAQAYTNSGAWPFNSLELKSTVIDRSINFSTLDPVLQERIGREDDGNITWTGQIEPDYTEDYTFYMIGDNGFKLWVNNQLIIDHWVNDWDVEQTSPPISLKAGEKYDLRIEYFEDFGGSNLYLRWSSASVSKQIVPETALYLPEGPMQGTLGASGQHIELEMFSELADLPLALHEHLSVMADKQVIAVSSAELIGESPAKLQLELEEPIESGVRVTVSYDGKASLETVDGTKIKAFDFDVFNVSERVDYSPISIAMSFYGSPKTNRSFAWYTNYEHPDNAPANAVDSIVEVVRADQDFNSTEKLRFVGDPDDTQILNLRITDSTNGSFISHKVLVEGLEPGTDYKYRVGSDGNWSDIGTFTTEAEDEKDYEFLYMTDSQGANSSDYQVWANTLGQGVEKYPESQFLVMTGDMVDAGALEYQWLDYFAKPQDLLMDLPLMAAVGNHEGPYNDNYYYHFYYPNDQIEDPLPPGSVYSFDYGDAHFMVMNTMDMGWDDRQRESFKQQIDWLEREVAQTDKKWKVVAFHKAIYSVGGHATDDEIKELRDMLYPVFDELGIDVVLQGHDHSYMRSHQMYNDEPILDYKTDGNGNPLNPDGTMYIVNNSAGTKYYDVKEDLDKYYAAYYEQPRTPIYSGVRMTEDSFTIESYRSDEDVPFDTYTIVRDDDRPEAVQGLVATNDEAGRIVLNWSKPVEEDAEDAVRGFRIYEVDGKLGYNWSMYVPVVEGLVDYQYIVENIDTHLAYSFAVKAVDKRDNSMAVTVDFEPDVIAAPTAPVLHDGYNTFGWTPVPAYEELTDYEYSIDSGESWQPVDANPQFVGDADYATGAVMIRVRADEDSGRPAGLPLVSTEPFTKNSIHDTYIITATLNREDQLVAEITVDREEAYSGEAYLVVELLDQETPLLINAIPIRQDELTLTQYFNVTGSDHRVKVYVFDAFDSKLELPLHLAQPIVLE